MELCTDICRRRNGKRKLGRIADRDKALVYAVKSDEMLLTVHRWFARKSCPGNWLFERMERLGNEVNGKLGMEEIKSRQFGAVGYNNKVMRFILKILLEYIYKLIYLLEHLAHILFFDQKI